MSLSSIYFLIFSMGFFQGGETEDTSESVQVKDIDLNDNVDNGSNTEEIAQNSKDQFMEDEIVDDAFSREIIPGEETSIKIEKGSNGLGLSIVGGSDTLLVRCHLFLWISIFFGMISTSFQIYCFLKWLFL